MDQDAQNLDLLSIFHYVVGGLAALFSMFPVIHLVIGLGLLSGRIPADDEPAIRMVGIFFVVIASLIILCGLTMTGLIVWAGVNLKQRTRYTFCLVIAGIECLFMPFGTVLGVLTIVMLMKDPVKLMFGVVPAGAPRVSSDSPPQDH